MKRLAVVLSIFILLGLTYSLVTPIFETPDEFQHFAALQYIARTGKLPVVGRPDNELSGQEGYQAPLYYVLGAALTSWIDTSDLRQQFVPQPKANFGDPAVPGKKNAFIHGLNQAFPYHGTTLAVHIARVLSTLLGAGTVALTYIMARFVFAGDAQDAKDDHLAWLALLCAGFLAFIPQFVFIHSATSNDTAITLTSTLALVILLWLARDGVTLRRAALLGGAIGLMTLSKLVGSVLAVVAILLLLLLISRRLDVLGMTLAVAAAVSGWWYIRNQTLYGDPLALGALLGFLNAKTKIVLPPLDSLWNEFRLIRFTTWGLFGQMSILMQPTVIYQVLDTLALVGGIGFAVRMGVQLIQVIRRESFMPGVKSFVRHNQARLICLVWAGTVAAAGLYYLLSAGLQGRLLFPGLPAAVVLFIYGLRFFFRRVPPQAMTLALVVPMLALTVSVIPVDLLPAYTPPPLVTQVPKDAIPVEATFGGEIKLRGYTLARNGNQLSMTFYWETLRTPPVDYTVAIRFVRPDGSFWLDYVNYPGMGTSMPTTWKPGELRRDDYVFDLRRFEPADVPLRWIVGYFDPRTREMTPVSDWGDVREAGWATLRQVDLSK
jgi:hypothetical protein